MEREREKKSPVNPKPSVLLSMLTKHNTWIIPCDYSTPLHTDMSTTKIFLPVSPPTHTNSTHTVLRSIFA